MDHLNSTKDLLPPFGVRGLCSPDKPFSVLRLSERQYDASVTSYPSSALTWIDEDDGEVVTVGTGGELRERLSDPIPSGNPQITYLDEKTAKMEDKYIHLFDIAQSRTSLDVWKEHEAYFSKTQIQRQVPTDEVEEREENIAVDQQDTTSPKQKSENVELVFRPTSKTSPVGSFSSSSLPNLLGDLGSQLDNLAGFLQGTSNSLRKAAEKTRETETSPIEDVLAGMTTILGEVGAFGLDCMDKLVEQPVDQTQVDEATSSTQIDETGATENGERYLSCSNLPVSSKTTFGAFIPQSFDGTLEIGSSEQFRLAKNSRTSLLDEELSLLQDVIELNRHDRAQTLARRSESGDVQAHQTAELGRAVRRREIFAQIQKIRSDLDGMNLRGFDPISTFRAENPQEETSISPISPSQAILDQDPDAIDAAFCARYPPLKSLRRAKTLDTIRDRQSEQHNTSENPRPRFIRFGQPCPKVFDAETQRRKEFAKSCFPAQEYTPGPGTTFIKMNQPKNTSIVTSREIPKQTADQSNASDMESSFVRDTDSSVSSNDSDVQSFIISVPSEQSTSNVCSSSFGQQMSSLPGSWPDTTKEKSSFPQDAVQESSGAFFNRMIQNLGSQEDSSRSGLQLRGHSDIGRRHHSVLDTKTRSKPAGDLKRSQTVNSTNPAARLNSPFDPLFPAPIVPRLMTEGQPPPPKLSAGPIRTVHRNLSDRRPKSLYEPYRTANNRMFEPVWEEHVQLSREPETPTGVVIVDASYFAPGTTEQEIRDLLADDCRTVIGINTLISCRIISTEPVVVAKLVIKDKSNADHIIGKFNNRWVNGRLLHLEYSKTGTDARINRIRGALPPVQSPAPRHLRSTPDLKGSQASQSLSDRDTFRLRPIQPATPDMASLPGLPSPPVKFSLPQLPPAPHNLGAQTVNECEMTLKAMGYGKFDAALFSRLHVYAAAAEGSIEAAIEMIEEDKKANSVDDLEHSIRKPRSNVFEDESVVPSDSGMDDNDDRDDELEEAIKRSIEER